MCAPLVEVSPAAARCIGKARWKERKRLGSRSEPTAPRKVEQLGWLFKRLIKHGLP